MYTIIETDIFKRYAEAIWDEDERDEFINWLAANPLDGDVVPGSGGMRKVRWTRSGMGKRGGTRVIYYNTLSEGSIWLLIAYTKAKFDDLPLAFLKQLKEEISDGR
ncbi:transcriptional regulator [Pseudomonas fluorescens]|nr:transcriptional regulator [Pseudomonas fluorescens]